jgi:hypothetical protein
MMDRRSMLRTLAAGACGTLALRADGSAVRSIAEEAVTSKLEHLRNARWSEERALQYMERFREVKGCNYVPSDGSGILVSPNTALLRRELGWATDVAGLNCVRFWVELADYQINADRLFVNFDSFLDLCHENGIRVLPVLSIQSVVDPDVNPAVAAADQPTLRFQPSVHGGGYHYAHRIGWPCCDPGGTIPEKVNASWERIRPTAEKFFRDFLKRYGRDERVLLWDLDNEAPRAARPFVETIFEWAREEAPSQPLSVCWQGHDLSDVITFHTYARPGLETSNRNPPGWDFLNELDWARAWGRPMICTEWLARPFGNTIAAILPFFERYHIGWFVWGLCAGGPAQFQFPWQWPIGSPTPKEWFHCLLYPDGTLYSAEELLAIHNFRYRSVPTSQLTQSFWSSWEIDINEANDNIRSPKRSSIVSNPPAPS